MKTLSEGTDAPEIPGVRFDDGPTAIWFYKVTCPVCQLAAPKAALLERAYPGHVVGVGQDPGASLSAFAREFEMGLASVSDEPPYPLSNAYGIETVPTLFLVGEDGTILDRVVSWDREGYNRLASRMADLKGSAPVTISEPSDGLPPFRPG